MQKKLIPAVIVGLLVVGGAFLIIGSGSGDDTKTSTVSTKSSSSSNSFIAVDACDVLTESAAKKVLGDAASKGDTAAGDVASDDVSVSNCVYTVKSTGGTIKEQLSNSTSASVLARAAKTSKGAESNKYVFGEGKPKGVQDVSGYGDKAYFNPDYGQLNILEGNNWYIISNHKGSKATEGTLAEAKVLADAIKTTLK